MTSPAPSPSSLWIIETTQERFEADVIRRSHDVPVVVDFWAAWCQPCRLLGPILEKVAADYEGKFVLVKADTEQLPAIAQAMGVQGIPAVFAFRDGQLVGQFVGVVPEDEFRRFVDSLLPSEAEQLARDAGRLEESQPADSRTRYEQALALDDQLAAAKIGLARLDLAAGRIDEATARLAELAERGFMEPEAQRLRSAVQLRRKSAEAGNVVACQAAADASPDDLGLRLRLAEALASENRHEEAFDILVDLVARDRAGAGEEARQTMIELFDVLGADSPLVSHYRRRLSAALY